MSTQKHINSVTSESTSTALVIAPTASEALKGTTSAGSSLEEQFAFLCAEAKEIKTAMSVFVARNVLKLGEVLYKAKVIYEKMTGTGHGKRRKGGVLSFDHEVANRTGVHHTLVQKYCRIGKMKPETKALLEGSEVAGNLTAVERLAQAEAAATLEAIGQAVAAFDAGGREAMDEILDTAAPKKRKTTTRGSSKKRELPQSDEHERASTLDRPTAAGPVEALPPAVTKSMGAGAARDEIERSIGSSTTANEGTSTAPAEPEEILVPILGGLGKHMFMGVEIWVKVLPSTTAKGGLGVWISTKEPASPKKSTPAESPDRLDADELIEAVESGTAAAAE